MTDREPPALVWFRRDLRLSDNPAWAAATHAASDVVACFVIEPSLLVDVSPARADVLWATLAALDAELAELGGSLVVLDGPAGVAIPAFAAELGGSSVWANRDGSRFSRTREQQVAEGLAGTLELYDGNVVQPYGSVLTAAGRLSQVFTPFYRRWSTAPVGDAAVPGSGRPLRMSSLPMPEPSDSSVGPCGAAAATARLDEWLDQIADYTATRDCLAADGTSGLSMDLKFGTISARTVVERCLAAGDGADAFVRQLAWRDWWAHMLMVTPTLDQQPVRAEYGAVEWCNDRTEFEAWAEGRTGVPVVDAGMRQLAQTGQMHNRARMICASYLVKDLLIDWRWGAAHFRRHLLDFDVSQNAGNWQWIAGTGPDAAPYFRVFNPVTQSKRFDPDGEYIRRWVPELRDVAAPDIHEPDAAPPLALADAGVIIGDDYPPALVDHRWARERTLSVYAEARAS